MSFDLLQPFFNFHSCSSHRFMNILINEWGNLPLVLPFNIMLTILGYYILLNVRNSLSNPTHRMTCYWEKKKQDLLIWAHFLPSWIRVFLPQIVILQSHCISPTFMTPLNEAIQFFFCECLTMVLFLFSGYIANPLVRISEDFTVNFLKTTMGQATSNSNWAIKCKALNENPVCTVTTASFSIFLCLC